MRKLLWLLLAASALAQTPQGGITVAASAGTTFTKVQFMGSNTQCASTSAACTFTPTSATTIGHVGVVMVLAGANDGLSSVSGGGGTWTVQGTSGTGCANYYAGSATFISCAYNLGYTSSSSTLTITLSGAPGAGNPYIVIYAEYSYTGPTPALDTSGGRSQTSAVSPVPGITLTLGGSTDVIVQCMGYQTPTGITGGSPSYGNFTNPGGAELSCADSENTASGTAPNWTVGSASLGNLSAIALK